MKSYLLCLRFYQFLNLWIGIFRQFCKILSHHFFNYGLCSYSLSPQIKCILPSMTVNPIFILLSLYNLFCIFFLIYISNHLPISSVGNFLLNPDIEFNWGYILFFISRSLTWLFFICQGKFQNFLGLPLISLQSRQKNLQFMSSESKL